MVSAQSGGAGLIRFTGTVSGLERMVQQSPGHKRPSSHACLDAGSQLTLLERPTYVEVIPPLLTTFLHLRAELY